MQQIDWWPGKPSSRGGVWGAASASENAAHVINSTSASEIAAHVANIGSAGQRRAS
jgi:hypothetical protein